MAPVSLSDVCSVAQALRSRFLEHCLKQSPAVTCGTIYRVCLTRLYLDTPLNVITPFNHSCSSPQLLTASCGSKLVQTTYRLAAFHFAWLLFSMLGCLLVCLAALGCFSICLGASQYAWVLFSTISCLLASTAIHAKHSKHIPKSFPAGETCHGYLLPLKALHHIHTALLMS